ncbi:DMT family transporter [Celeribacter arenosi]|uniref:DMT family transporter n=2 Tax=Celeribacter arenosi TaxID=792649 RepID=A0ABP7JSX9_9RHOB
MSEAQHARPVAGILWMLATTLLFISVNVTVKFVGDGLPIFESAFLRFLLGLILLVPMLGQARHLKMTPRLWKLSLARAVFHGFAMTAWFFAMTRIPMAEVTAMNFMNPLYVTIGAVLIFGEKLRAPRIAALFVAFLGGLLILRPGMRDLDAGHVAMIFTAMLFAGSYLIGNRLSREMPATMVVFLLSISVPFVLAPFALANWVTPSLHQLVLLFITAVCATLGHYSMTRAFACAPQTVIQPVTFVQLVWSVLLGWTIFGEVPDLVVILGGVMIMGAVTFITWREARRKADVPESVKH